jgi:arsenical pump membrane protein
VASARAGGTPLARIARGISWELLPFLYLVFVLALALANAGLTDPLAALFTRSPWPLPTVGAVAAVGSAAINNHPMALLDSLALSGMPHRLVYAALVGGDLGPRLLPHGSLAGLLWLHALRRRGVRLPLATFVRVGLVVTIPTLAASLVALWLIA